MYKFKTKNQTQFFLVMVKYLKYSTYKLTQRLLPAVLNEKAIKKANGFSYYTVYLIKNVAPER